MTAVSAVSTPVVTLPYGDLPWREVVGNPYIEVECDPDGDPLHLILDSPPSGIAERVTGGCLNWWGTAMAIRNAEYPKAWPAPPGVTITTTGGPAEYLVVGPGGAMIVRRTAPASPEPTSLSARLWVWLTAWLAPVRT